MNVRAALLTVFLASAAGQSAWAHENHTHQPARPEIGEEQAKTRAREEVERLVSIQKLDASWKESGALKGVEKKKVGKKWEWLATFENATVADPSKKVLYVFLKPSGEYVAANFTGK
ncbi:hypothetical protein HPC49_54205 [Pyxidicoccus fallax]|uniref:Lipoprotein n=1 Tax=Pyxidicoccus fallax TaxID=394095 RepID=A0A848LZ32_9BACT|nr:DUF6488 family protein [Pyxidicoccus fallax]NMO22860.1 hypothetical protein [Pyxidicoccus fallax]NPC87120.1 hypothetical protein [Pyxidicoccus fallax]